MDAEFVFWELCDKALQLDKSIGEDNRGHEPPMVEIIELVEKHPERRDVFVRCFSEIVMWRRQAPWSLVAFCMRRLQLPEIKELIHRDMDAHKGTAYYAGHMNYWSTIMHAYYDTVWQEANMWPYYFHELETGRSQDTEPPL